MEMTNKIRVGLGLMTELALREGKKPVSLASVAQQLDASVSHLENLCACLRGKGLILATRGPGGGYTLARSAAEITLLEIVLAVEAPAKLIGDAFSRPAVGEEDAITQVLFQSMQDHATAFLGQMLLTDVLPVKQPVAPGRAEMSLDRWMKQWSPEAAALS